MDDLLESLKKAPGFVCMTPASEEEILEAEKNLGLQFSKEYKSYVSGCGVASIKGHELTGICKSKRLNVVDTTCTARDKIRGIPEDFYVIEEIHVDGIVVWQNTSGSVYLSKPDGTVKKIATSMQEFLSV